MTGFKRKQPVKFIGTETFVNTGGLKMSLADFWSYGFSNLNSNILRGVLAEFLVENAVNGSGKIGTRNPWEDFDVLGPKDTKIEVKCSSYLQDWDQKSLSTIAFSGLKAKSVWNEGVADYKADVYVLAYIDTKDPQTLNLLDLDQWKFFVLSKGELSKAANNTSRISLTKLLYLGFTPVSFKDLVSKINSKIKSPPTLYSVKI